MQTFYFLYYKFSKILGLDIQMSHYLMKRANLHSFLVQTLNTGLCQFDIFKSEYFESKISFLLLPKLCSYEFIIFCIYKIIHIYYLFHFYFIDYLILFIVLFTLVLNASSC